MFVGGRKIGKTSLLFHLMRPEVQAGLRLGDKNLCVYLDCEVLGDIQTEEIFGQFALEMDAALEARGCFQRRFRRVMRAHFPFEMAVKMLLKPLALPAGVQRALLPMLTRVAGLALI